MAAGRRGRRKSGGPAAGPSVAQVLKPLWTQVYLPNLLFATGRGAMLPILIYAARSVHASPAMATAIVAVNGFGTLLFDLPSGWIVARFGERRAAWVASALICTGLAGCLVATSVAVLAVSVFLQGAGWALWSLVQLTHLSRVAATFARGRALSLFGGVIRAGNVIGPFLFVLVASSNDTDLAFAIYLAGVIVGFAWMVGARDRADRSPSGSRTDPVHPLAVLRDHRRGFATAGVGAIGISLLRGSRTAMVPLWAAHIGLDSATAATIYAYSSLIELAFFYPAGIVSDRWGRRSAALPCLVLLSVGHLLLPFSHAFTTLLLVALVLGFGNAAGSGIVMTLGADLSPEAGRASFLAVWRAFSDGGTMAGPLLDTAVIGASSISFAAPVVGIVGLMCAAVVARWLPEPRHLARRAEPVPGTAAGPSPPGLPGGAALPDDAAVPGGAALPDAAIEGD